MHIIVTSFDKKIKFDFVSMFSFLKKLFLTDF